jgi:LuxR family transcriptional regulator, maltose regulon positive regulatory protein
MTLSASPDAASRHRHSADGEGNRRRGAVPRPGLVNRLRAARGAGVVLVTAPPGYGKTSLIEDWSERDGRLFVWVGAARNEDTPAFARRLTSSVLAGVRTGARRRGGTAVTAVQSVAEAARILAVSQVPVVVVVDDIDLLSTDDGAAMLMRFADELPAGSQLVLAGRSTAALPVARWRASGRLFELTTDDLRFTNREAGALFRGTGVLLPQRLLSALNEKLEGWPAGLYLAASALRSPGVDVDALLERGLEPALEYLRNEVVAALPEADLDFLMRVAVLERLCPGLCDAVVGAPHSERVLERLERTNLFVAPIDRERRWYRIHSVLRDVLIDELERRAPGAALALHRRAAAWCVEHGETELALEHARAGDDIEQLLDVIEHRAVPFIPAAHPATVARWLKPLDDEAILARRPTVAGIGALAWALLGRPEEAERWLGAAETQQQPPVLLQSLIAPRSAADIRLAAELALASLELGSLWRAPLLVVLASAHVLEGDAAAADAALEEAADAAAAGGDRTVEVIAVGQRCLLATSLGDWARADLLAGAARLALADAHLEDHGAAVFALAASARTALRHGNWAALRSDLEQAQARLPQVTYVLAFYAVSLRLEFARIQLALGDGQAARNLLREIDDVYARRPQLGVLVDEVASFRSDLERTDREMATLTAAELRLLPLLTTHLSFREIADRLFVSRNTVKTQAISVYRKLGVSSRGEAIDRASGLGLVAAAPHADTP